MNETPNRTIENSKRLIEQIVSAADLHPSLAARRQAMVTSLIDLTGASVGYWAWGHGDGSDQTVMPVAWIQAGFDDHQMGSFVKASLSNKAQSEFVDPIKRLMGEKSRMTVVRNDLYDDIRWRATLFHRHITEVGLDEWVQCIHYGSPNNWAQLALYRNVGMEPFGEYERGLIDLAMTSIAWLHGSSVESIPPSKLLGLTPRQHTVMFMLLDGHSRKQVASKFAITEQTVGDHVKEIYRFFNINSLGELAALFLRGK